MNRVTGEKAASSQDAQKQMQGQPTAAQEAMGAKPTALAVEVDAPLGAFFPEPRRRCAGHE